MRSIHDDFQCDPECSTCLGTGHVCEDHPDQAWGPMVGDLGTGGCHCGAAGMPCPDGEAVGP